MMNKTDTLNAVIEYSMNDLEARAYKVALIYLEKAPKFFPEYKHYRLPKGDPRKSELFRYCYKFLREKQEKIPDTELKLYIHAQLEIMRGIRKGDSHPFITPACLAGDKAWKRWLLWKNRYDKLLERKASSENASTLNTHNEHKIKKDLWKTKQFLMAWFDNLNIKNIQESLANKNLFNWVSSGSVCGYYLLLSPIVKNWILNNKIDLMKEFGIDMKIYKNCISQQILEYFNKEFSYENE